MRTQDKIVVWPVYFDSTKARSQGRRVPKSLSVPNPKLEEVCKAAELAGLKPEVISEVAHPRTPWRRTGVLLVPKKGSKLRILKEIGRRLGEVRRRAKS